MKAIQKITAVFLALVFLFSSFGFTVSSMVCLKSGKGKVSLAYMEDCCAKKENSASENPVPVNDFIIKKASCCEINNYSIRLNDFQNAQKLSPEQPVILHTLFNAAEALHVSQTSPALAYGYTDLPPPLHGRTLLNFISILLI